MKDKVSIIVIIFCLLILIWSYNSIYNTKNNSYNIEKNVEGFINKSLEDAKNKSSVHIMDSIIIDNKKFIVFSNNGALGFGELSKGINNKYKIIYTSYTNSVFNIFLCKTNKSEYLIVVGKNNYSKKISNMQLIYKGKEYIIAIPQKDYYISYFNTHGQIESAIYDSVVLFNNKNIDITNDIFNENSKYK